jgi:hypothetical protein
MALAVVKGVISSPASTGIVSYSLGAPWPAGTLPKALILWCTNQTADGVDLDSELAIGFGTDRGGTAASVHAVVTDDNATAAVTVSSGGSSAAIGGLMRLYTPGTVTEIARLSLDSFATDQFSINWGIIPTSGTKFHYVVLGGSDITDALTGTFSVATSGATQNVTVGFQPDLLLLLSTHATAVGGVTDTVGQLMLAIAKSNTSRRCAVWNDDDGSAAMDVGYWNHDRALLALDDAANTADAEADLSAVATWPADGFQLSVTNLPATTLGVYYLALKGTFQSALGTNTCPTAGTPPIAQDNNAGFVPKLGLMFGSNVTAKTTIDTTHAALGAFIFGAFDGTNEGLSWIWQDDGNANSQADRQHYETLAYWNGAITADGSFSGNNLRLTWSNVDTEAREYNWLALGDASGPPPERVMQRGRRLDQRASRRQRAVFR